MLSDARLRGIAGRLVEVPGVAGVMLGGSRGRGTEQPDSDVDLGLYYRPPLDLARLRALARDLVDDGQDAVLTEPGAWGRWVDGGGWLRIDGIAVDWLYRDLDRVQAAWRSARAGAFDFHFQVGHPLGVPDFAYAGEVGLGVVLADPTDELTTLKTQAQHYPPRLAEAVLDRLGEADFLLGALAKPANRGDVAFVAGTLFRVVGLCAHALHARAGRWVVTEKGLIDAAGRLPSAPPDFTARAHAILGGLGNRPQALVAAVQDAAGLVTETAGRGQAS